MVRTQIQLSEEQIALLKKLAKTRHFSMAEVIRQAVDNMVKTSAVIDLEERRKRAISAAGRFHSGLHDLSTSHDKHLTEVFGR